MPLRALRAALFSAPARQPAAAPATKASATAPLIALHHTGQPVWTPKDYAALAREGYRANAGRLSRVRMIAEGGRACRCCCIEGDTELDRASAARPAGAAERRGVRAGSARGLVYGYLLIAGNAYMEAVSVGGRACASCMCCGPTG